MFQIDNDRFTGFMFTVVLNIFSIDINFSWSVGLVSLTLTSLLCLVCLVVVGLVDVCLCLFCLVCVGCLGDFRYSAVSAKI